MVLKNDSQAPLRHTKGLATVASSRTWRGLRAFVAQDPAIKPLGPVYGGEGGIRTHGTLPHTRFPSVLLRPLGHLSALVHLFAVAGAPRRGCQLTPTNISKNGKDGLYPKPEKKSPSFYTTGEDLPHKEWRRGWDSNPRCPDGHNGFRVRPVRPLRHLSALWSIAVQPRASRPLPLRRSRKKSRNRVAA